MSKYGVVFRVAISERLVYRADFFIATFLRFIPIITAVVVPIMWAILAAIFSWFYVIYFASTRRPDETK